MPARPALLGAIAAALVFAAGCSGTDAVSQSVAGSDGYQAGDAALRWVAPGHRAPVGSVHGRLLDGAPFDLAAWRGKVVVVNFWTSDCAPCRSEAQALNQVYVDDRSRGVRFLGVDIRDDRASALAFVRSHHVAYPSIYDPSTLVGLSFHGLAPNATPTTIVIDRDGRIAARHSGAILYTELADVVARVTGETA